MAEKENDIAIIPLSLGHIASYYDVRFGTMEILSAMLNEKLGREGLLEVLCSAEEFIDLPVRKHEENELLSLLRGSPLKLPNSDSKESRTKAHLLLQSHFSRKSLSADLEVDREEIVNVSMRLLAAMVDILASKGWLKPALNAMELCQMVTQALWSDSPPLLQLPHVDMKKAMELKEIGVESPLDFSGEKEEEIRKLISAGGGDDRFNDVVKTANAFPNPELTFKIEGETVAERPQKLICRVARDEDEERKTGGSDGKVSSGLVKVRKRGGEVMFKRTEAWWILIGQSKENRLLGVKRVAMTKNVIEVALEFIPPRESRDFVVFLVSDTYIGVDQEYELEINVRALSEKAKSNE